MIARSARQTDARLLGLSSEQCESKCKDESRCFFVVVVIDFVVSAFFAEFGIGVGVECMYESERARKRHWHCELLEVV